jgi:hypothetical protein
MLNRGGSSSLPVHRCRSGSTTLRVQQFGNCHLGDSRKPFFWSLRLYKTGACSAISRIGEAPQNRESSNHRTGEPAGAGLLARRRPWVRDRVGWIVDDRNAIDRLIDHTGLHAHDEILRRRASATMDLRDSSGGSRAAAHMQASAPEPPPPLKWQRRRVRSRSRPSSTSGKAARRARAPQAGPSRADAMMSTHGRGDAAWERANRSYHPAARRRDGLRNVRPPLCACMAILLRRGSGPSGEEDRMKQLCWRVERRGMHHCPNRFNASRSTIVTPL